MDDGVWFPLDEGPTIQEIIHGRTSEVPNLVYVQPDDTVTKALDLIQQYNLSRIIVAQGIFHFQQPKLKGLSMKSTYKSGHSKRILENEMLRSNGPSNEFRWVW